MNESDMKVEMLAYLLHESGKEANIAPQRFHEWNEISEEVKERCRIRARWLIKHGIIMIL